LTVLTISKTKQNQRSFN